MSAALLTNGWFLISLMATLLYGQGSWPWNCESLLKFIWKYSHGKLKLNYAWSWAFKCSVKRQMRLDYQSETISLPYHSCNWSFYIKHYNNSIIVRLWYVMVSWFGVRPASSRWVGRKSSRAWNIIHSMPSRTPCRYSFKPPSPLGPQAWVLSEVGQSQYFPTMSEHRVQWLQGTYTLV